MVYGKAYNGQVCEYGEPVFEFFQGHNERQPEVAQNAVRGESGRPRQFPSLQWHSTHTHEICTQGENKLGNPHGVLQGVATFTHGSTKLDLAAELCLHVEELL